MKGGLKEQRHRRLVATSCCIWLLTVLALVSCQNAPDVDGLRSLATEGDAAAQFDLGDRYFDGEGVPQDDGEAVHWFRLAADQDHAEAQYTLGLMYGAGRGVPQDYVAAHKWANLAADQGHENARQLRADLAPLASSAQTAAVPVETRAPQASTDLLVSTSTDTPCTPKELSPAAVELVRLYEELQTFKDDPAFFDEGFRDGTPYIAWYTAFDESWDENKSFFGRTPLELLDEVGFVPFDDVWQLGSDYQTLTQRISFQSKPEEIRSQVMTDAENDVTLKIVLDRVIDTEIKIQASLARARCEEPGTAVQEMVLASIEARRAYAAEPERASPFTIADRATLVPRIVRVYLDVNQIAELPVAERVRATVDGLADAAGRLNDLQREITQGPQQEYEAASARFAAAHEAAIYGDGILAAVLAEGEMVVALGTAIAADMAAIATAMAELEAMTPAEVPAEALASVTQSRRSYEQSAEGVKLVVETQRALVEQLRGLVAAEAR